MAINALKCSEMPNGSDSVGRQAAINAIISQEAVYADDAIDVLRRLPSVQPEPLWHECFEDDPSSFPDDERTVLVSCMNCSEPIPGQWRVDEDGGGNWYVGDLDETFLQDGLIVDGWWELPKKPERRTDGSD